MGYALNTIPLWDSWFEKNGKIMQIGVEGFHVFLNLFQSRIHGQDDYYTFYTCISSIVKDCNNPRKYTKKRVYELLLHLQKLNIIEIRNVSNPAAQLMEGKNVKGDKFLHIVFVDIDPNLIKTSEQRKEENSYITWLHFSIIEYLQRFDERYPLIYAMISKFSKGRERKCWINIDNMHEYIPISTNTIHDLVYEMNELHVIASDLRYVSKEKTKYEHRVCRMEKDTLEESLQHFWNEWGKQSTIKRGQKRRERKAEKKDHPSQFPSA